MSLADSLLIASTKGHEPARCGFNLCRAIIMFVRESRLLRPDLVTKFGPHLLEAHTRKLSQEKWALHEQIYMALLQYGRTCSPRKADGIEGDSIFLAQQYLNILSAHFLTSMRVKQLEGMMWEAKGEVDMAMAGHGNILFDDPSYVSALKRQVAVFCGRGRLAEAARKLVEYLVTFCSDNEAWIMLADVYLSAQQFKRAVFCTEELILANPVSYLLHVRYGETLYTMGISEKCGSHDQVLKPLGTTHAAHADRAPALSPSRTPMHAAFLRARSSRLATTTSAPAPTGRGCAHGFTNPCPNSVVDYPLLSSPRTTTLNSPP